MRKIFCPPPPQSQNRSYGLGLLKIVQNSKVYIIYTCMYVSLALIKRDLVISESGIHSMCICLYIHELTHSILAL